MTNHFDLSSGPGKRRAASGAVDMFPGSHDLVGMDLSPDLLSESFVRDQQMQMPYGSHFAGGPNPVQEWYANNDGPWHPKGIALPGSQNGINTAGLGFVFPGNYRENFSPSECDTIPIPSDSGYASHGAKQSIAAASICYDESLENHETQSLAGQFNMNMDMSNWNQIANQPQSHSVQRNPKSTARELSCETCHKVLKTNSELKKHKQRHTKPHLCQVEGCPRTEGFSTSNDLERHKRSVHPQETTSGNRYRCSLQACKHKEKIWPRADNFRAHIKRVHQQDITEEDLERFVIRSTIAPQDVLTDIAGMQPSVTDYNLHLGQSLPHQFPYWNSKTSATARLDRPNSSALVHQISNTHIIADQASDDQVSEIEMVSNDHTQAHTRGGKLESMPPPTSIAAATPGYPRGEELGDEQFITPSDLSQRDSSTTILLPDVDDGISAASEGVPYENMPDASDSDDEGVATPISPDEENASAESPDIAIPPTEDVSSLVMKLRDPKKIKEVLEALQTSGLLESLGYKKEQTPAANETEVEATKPRQDSQNVCPNCKKGFPRRCELKKHMKRHEKPYGCTFEGCNKRFGSKNDWKRHENSQHFLLEVWKCDFQARPGSPQLCGKVSHRRETFRQHLANGHQLSTPIIDRKLEECRVGRNCEANFWCGFCEKIIKIGSQGTEAWTKRYDHIDDHIAGRNNLPQKHMDDWKSVDPEAQSDANISATDGTNDKATVLPRPSAQDDEPSNLESTPRQLPRVTVNKRKANRSSENRPSKRSKPEGLFVTSCCNCGEVRSKMSPQCVTYDCQHNACDDCR